MTTPYPRPKRRTFVVYEYFDLRDYLIATQAITCEDAEHFWSFWCDCGPQSGPSQRAIRHVPLGYWGWEGKDPETQKPPEPSYGFIDEEKQGAYRVLLAMEQFRDEDYDLQVWVNW